MRKRLLILVLSLLVIVTAHAQPLVSTDSFSITFTPVLIEEVVEPGHEEGNVVYGPTVRFKLAYRVSTD